MRFNEIKFLLEKELSPKDIMKYPWRGQLFLSKVESGSPFETTDGQQVQIDPSELQRLENMINMGTIGGLIKLKDSDKKISLGKLKKTPEFAKEGGASGESAISNRGDVAEGIMSAALFAKLKARVDGKIAGITESDVWAVIDALKAAGGDMYSINVQDASKKVVNDSIIFTLQLPEPAYLDLVDPAKRGLLNQETSSSVLFANSEDNEKFSQYFYLNGKPDAINIICDGGNPAKQKVSKVDIEVIVTDKLTGKKHKQRMDISLKAVAKQFGQVGVGDARKWDYFEKQQTLWQHFGVDLSPIEKKFDKKSKSDLYSAIAEVYQYAAKIINNMLAGDNDLDEYAYLSTVSQGINYFATLNTPNVILVNLKGGGYEMISFRDMEKKLQAVDLAARYRADLSSPQVDVYDKKTKAVLFQVRLKWLADEKRNYIEKGPLMTTLFGTTIKAKQKK